MSILNSVLSFLPQGEFWKLSKNQVKYFILKVISARLGTVRDYLDKQIDAYLLKNNDFLNYYKVNFNKNFATKEDFIKLIKTNNLLTKTYFVSLVGKTVAYVDNRKISCNLHCNNNLGYFRGNFVIEVADVFTQEEYNKFKEVLKLAKHQYTTFILTVAGTRVYI